MLKANIFNISQGIEILLAKNYFYKIEFFPQTYKVKSCQMIRKKDVEGGVRMGSNGVLTPVLDPFKITIQTNSNNFEIECKDKKNEVYTEEWKKLLDKLFDDGWI